MVQNTFFQQTEFAILSSEHNLEYGGARVLRRMKINFFSSQDYNYFFNYLISETLAEGNCVLHPFIYSSRRNHNVRNVQNNFGLNWK